MKRKADILLCDLDAFYASVEQRDKPELRGKPVIVGGSPESRGVVSTCSYEARAYGVRSAMPMKKALALCPQAEVLRGNMARYLEVSRQVRQIFGQFTPQIELVSIDEAYLAVPAGSGCAVGEAIHLAVRKELGLPISVGVSVNKLLAKIACELAKPDKVGTLWPEEVAERLWPLPIRVLPGIGPVTEKNLQLLGIKTVKELAACPVSSLERILGKNTGAVLDFARGIDNRELELEHEVKSISEETTFAEDLNDQDAILAVLLELSAGVGYRLRRAGFLSRTITLKLRYGDFRTITRSRTLPEPVDGDSEIYRTVRALFSEHSGKPPWRLVGVQASGFELGRQLSLLTPSEAEEKEKQLTLTRDRLRKKYGSEVIIQAKRLKRKPPKGL
jgi:DNA polymerase IV